MSVPTPLKSELGDPTWEIASLFPMQGQWSEQDYLSLETNHLIEFSHGRLEVLPMPTELHQLIAFFLCSQLRNLNQSLPNQSATDDSRGVALMAPFRIRLPTGKFREPDVMYMLPEHRYRRYSKYWDGADLVIEVVSEDDPNRDLITKRTEYALAQIPEYWIVDPRDRSIYVLTLDKGATEYRQAGRYGDGDWANSILLPTFNVAVTSVFNQAQR